MTAISEIILSANTHPQDSSSQTIVGDRYKGDGFYSRSDGLHSIQWSIDNFIGIVRIQATLATNPGENDWFSVNLSNGESFTMDTTGKVSRVSNTSLAYIESTTGVFSYNFTGNYVWIRAKVDSWTSGSVNSIILSH